MVLIWICMLVTNIPSLKKTMTVHSWAEMLVPQVPPVPGYILLF